MENDDDIELVLTELRAAYQRTLTNMNACKETARFLIGAASIGLPLLSAARLVVPPQGVLPPDLRTPAILLTALGYLVMMAVCIPIINPTRVYGPIRPSRTDIESYYLRKDKRQAGCTMIVEYIDVNALNSLALEKLVRQTRLASWILVLDTVLLLILL